MQFVLLRHVHQFGVKDHANKENEKRRDHSREFHTIYEIGHAYVLHSVDSMFCFIIIILFIYL